VMPVATKTVSRVMVSVAAGVAVWFPARSRKQSPTVFTPLAAEAKAARVPPVAKGTYVPLAQVWVLPAVTSTMAISTTSLSTDETLTGTAVVSRVLASPEATTEDVGDVGALPREYGADGRDRAGVGAAVDDQGPGGIGGVEDDCVRDAQWAHEPSLVPHADAHRFAAVDTDELVHEGDALKTVVVVFRDAAGNVSVPVSDTILLDTERPTAPVLDSDDITLNIETATATKRTVPVTLRIASIDDAFSHYEVIGGVFNDWTDVGLVPESGPGLPVALTADGPDPDSDPDPCTTVSAAPAGVPFNIGLRAVDEAGNISGESFFTVQCDEQAPTVPRFNNVLERSGGLSATFIGQVPTDAVAAFFHFGTEVDASGVVVDDGVSAQGTSPLVANILSSRSIGGQTLSGLTNDELLFLQVEVLDAAGNVGRGFVIEALPNPISPKIRSETQLRDRMADLAGGFPRLFVNDAAGDVCALDTTENDTALLSCVRGQDGRIRKVGPFLYNTRLNRPTLAVNALDPTRLTLETSIGVTANDVAHLGASYAVVRGNQLSLARRASNTFSAELATQVGADFLRTFNTGDVLVAVDASGDYVAVTGRRGTNAFVAVVDYNAATGRFVGQPQELIITGVVPLEIDASGAVVAVATDNGVAIFTKDGTRFIVREQLLERRCRDVQIAAGLVYCASDGGFIEVFDLNSSFRTVHIGELVNINDDVGTHVAVQGGLAMVASSVGVTAVELTSPQTYEVVNTVEAEMGDVAVDGARMALSTSNGILLRDAYFFQGAFPLLPIAAPSPAKVELWGKSSMVFAHPALSSAFSVASLGATSASQTVLRPTTGPCEGNFPTVDIRVDGDQRRRRRGLEPRRQRPGRSTARVYGAGQHGTAAGGDVGRRRRPRARRRQ